MEGSDPFQTLCRADGSAGAQYDQGGDRGDRGTPGAELCRDQPEDIAAPAVLPSRRLYGRGYQSVFHDDQHGTAVVCLAALLNALRVVDKSCRVKIVINGAGAAARQLRVCCTGPGPSAVGL